MIWEGRPPGLHAQMCTHQRKRVQHVQQRACVDDRRYPYAVRNVFEVTVAIPYGEHRHINMLLYLQAQYRSATCLRFSVDSRGVTHRADNNLLIVKREKEREHKVKSRMITRNEYED